MRLAKPTNPADIISAIALPRLTKYLAIKPVMEEALELYAWNAHVSAAFMVPAHFAEVVTRNAVSDTLAAIYGHQWPWSQQFEFSLPSPQALAYNPRRDLIQTRNRHLSTGKVIADLKFAF